MPLPQPYAIDFDVYRKDLVEQALNRMLSQHYDKCVLRQFVAAFINEAQEAYDAILDMQQQRVVYFAQATNLDALGRIVGEDRAPWSYDESSWMFFDGQGQGFDQIAMWCINAPMGTFIPVMDDQYRTNIIGKAVKNHTLVASVPEITSLTDLLLGLPISFEKTGPNQVRIVVPDYITATQLYLITRSFTDERVDKGYFLPYPATLDFDSVVMYTPDKFFCFDRTDRQYDVAKFAVGVNHNWR